MYLCSFSHVEQVAAQNLVLRWLAPAVPRGSLHGHDKTRAAPIVACPNDLEIRAVGWVRRIDRQTQLFERYNSPFSVCGTERERGSEATKNDRMQFGGC